MSGVTAPLCVVLVALFVACGRVEPPARRATVATGSAPRATSPLDGGGGQAPSPSASAEAPDASARRESRGSELELALALVRDAKTLDDVVSDAPRVEGLRASPSRIGRTGKSLGYKSQLLCALLSFSRPLEVADLVAALGIARPLARAPYECAGYWCTACSAAARLECGPRDPHYPSHWVMLDGSGLKSIAGAPAAARVGAFEVVPHLQLPDGDADAPGPLVRFLGGSGHDLSKVSGETAPRVSDLEVCLPPD